MGLGAGSSRQGWRHGGPRRDPRSRPISRRALLGAGAGGVGLLAGCVRSDDERPSEPLIIGPVATPIANVPEFNDPTRWKGRTVRVGAWGGEVQTVLRDVVWGPFGAATGATIAEVTTDYGELQRSIQGGEAYADALIVDPIWAVTALREGLVDPLPEGTVEPEGIAPVVATEGTVPAYAYAMVSAFRREVALRVGEPTSWAEWWDVERYTGPRALPRGAFACFEFALLADGVAPEELYPLDGARAIESLKRISGKIVDRWWDSGLQPVSWLARRRADYVAAWHYRVVAGKLDGRAVEYRWNQGLLVVDHWAIPRGAANADVAADLIRYALHPLVQGAVARRIPLGPTVPAAFADLEPRTMLNLPTAPDNLPALVLMNAEWWAANNVEANERFNNWLLGVPMNE